MSRRCNGEGTIYKRSDGRWVGSISLERSRRKYFYGGTRQEVGQKLTAALRARDQGVPIPSEQLTVERYLAQWLETVRQSVRPKTYEAYDLNVRRVLPHLGGVRVARLDAARVQACYNALLAGGLSRRSVEQVHAVLHRALRQALLWGHTVQNPTEAVNVPRPSRKEMRTLSHEEVQRLFTTTSADRFHTLWVLLTTTGVRIGEALGLKWSDLDLENNRLNIHRALQRQRGVGLVFVEPKTERSRRLLHLSRQTATALGEQRRRQLEERLAAGPSWQENGLVFCREDGRPLEGSAVHARLQLALRAAGLPHVRVHDLRHTAATLLLGQGVHPRVVQELLGHSTITLTLDTYSHVTPALHQEAANQMDILFRTG